MVACVCERGSGEGRVWEVRGVLCQLCASCVRLVGYAAWLWARTHLEAIVDVDAGIARASMRDRNSLWHAGRSRGEDDITKVTKLRHRNLLRRNITAVDQSGRLAAVCQYEVGF